MMKPLFPLVVFAGLYLLSANGAFAYDPSDYRGLMLWLDAGRGVMTEDNAGRGGSPTDVRRWSDLSSNGIEITNRLPDRATRPQWIQKVSQIGGKPAIEFDGRGGSHFRVTESLLGRVKRPFDLNRATIFMVARWRRHGAMAPLVLGPTANHRTGRGGVAIRRGGDPAGWFGVHNGGPGNVERLQTIEPKVDDHYHVFAAIFDKRVGLIRLFLDGKDQNVSIRNRSKVTLDPVTYVQIGGQGLLDAPGERGSEWYFGGQLAEIVVFNHILKNRRQPRLGRQRVQRGRLVLAAEVSPERLVHSRRSAARYGPRRNQRQHRKPLRLSESNESA